MLSARIDSANPESDQVPRRTRMCLTCYECERLEHGAHRVAAFQVVEAVGQDRTGVPHDGARH